MTHTFKPTPINTINCEDIFASLQLSKDELRFVQEATLNAYDQGDGCLIPADDLLNSLAYALEEIADHFDNPDFLDILQPFLQYMALWDSGAYNVYIDPSLID